MRERKYYKGLTRREFLKTTATVTAAAWGAGSSGLFRSTAQAAIKTNVVFAMTQEPVQFNPLLYASPTIEKVPESCFFDALWDVNDKGEFVPNLVTGIPTVENKGISPDGTIWRIELRRDVRWHDGHPFTAKDVEFTYKTIMNPAVAVRTRMGFDIIKEFKVIDDFHFEMILSKAFAPYMWVWQSMHIIPEHILSKVPDINKAPFNNLPIGTGLFTLQERVPGSHIIFKRNPHYHRKGLPRIESFILKIIPDRNVAYTQFRTGEIDFLGIMGIPPEREKEARRLPERDVMVAEVPGVEFIYFNCEKPQFKDPRVRRALYAAFDKERIIGDVYYGTQLRTLSYLNPHHWAYNIELKDPGYNPREAAQLLDAAGWRVGPDGIRQKEGVKLQFTMSTTAGDKAREQAQALIQQNWKEINVSMEIRNFPGSVVWGEYMIQGKYDTLMTGYPPVLGADPDYTARCHSKQIPAKYKAGMNFSQFENAELDKLLEEGVVTLDRAKRKDIYWKIQKILHDEVPFAPIFSRTYLFGKKSDLKGYRHNPYLNDQTWNIEEWYWE